MASLREVARLAGVDPSTASRVLRGDPAQAVRAETRQRIVDAAAKLDYRPNQLARALRSRRTGTVGLLVNDVESLGFASVSHGVQAAAKEEGYLVLLVDVGSLGAGGAVETDVVFAGRVDGLLVAGDDIHEDVLRQLSAQRLPAVSINRRLEGQVPSVTADEALGSRMAVEHLASLGHKRIAHIAGDLATETAAQRLAGYREALAELRIAARPGWVVEGGATEAGGADAISRLWRARRGSRPTAVHVANLSSGLGVLSWLRHAGVEVPVDVSLVVTDEHFLAAHTAPPLTTVQMPVREIGKAALRTLVRMINGEQGNDLRVPDPPRLIARGSTAAPPS